MAGTGRDAAPGPDARVRPMRSTGVPLGAIALGFAYVACQCGKGPGLRETAPVMALLGDVVDFGPVAEFTSKTLQARVENRGRAPLHLQAQIAFGSSPEFTLGAFPEEVAAGTTVELPVTFSPVGGGTDEGSILLTSDDPVNATGEIRLRGGPIGPAASLKPEPLDFAPARQPLESRYGVVASTGLSTLSVRAVGVAPGGNPDFSIKPPKLPAQLKPGEELAIEVVYARSSHGDEGKLEVHSDDPAAETRFLRLLPDPVKACGDGADNDGDGLVDFPDDPGCTNADDTDEYNPPECLNGAAQPCGTAVGTCRPGTRLCKNSIWGPCTGGVSPTAEACDGLDNDCNGRNDDGITEACTINGCAGARSCVENSGVAGGQWGPCLAVGATTETCDGKDNDCDGAIDEGITESCVVNGCAGTRICVPGGTGQFTACVPTSPQPETCNGKDDDCNGQTDDGIPDLRCGQGVCARTAPACVNGQPGTCTAGIGSPEVCDNLDNDCNGSIDDGVTRGCYTGTPPSTKNVGVCKEGTETCTGGAWGPCTGQVTPGIEACNNLDDDCDTSTDENLTQACYTGQPPSTKNIGECKEGSQTCTAGAWSTTCLGEVVPAAETCNNKDDDCDTSVDEALTRACFTVPAAKRNVGKCKDGTQTCTAGIWSTTCANEVLPDAAETCGNSVDDDCNGSVDDGCTCSPDGLYLNTPKITYACCSGVVSVDITRFNFVTTGTTLGVTPGPTWSPSLPMTGNRTTCPIGNFDVTRVETGGCIETYRLIGNFTGTQTWSGTFTIRFTGDAFQCSCFGGALGSPCVDQTITVTATK